MGATPFNADLTESTRNGFDEKEKQIKRLTTSEFPILSLLLKGRTDKRDPKYRKATGQLFKETVPKNTRRKYLEDKNGLVINKAIYFDTGETRKRHVRFDDITHEIEIYKKIYKDNLNIPLPVNDTNEHVVDQLLPLFRYDYYSKFNGGQITMMELDEILREVRLKLLLIKQKSTQPGATLHYRDILDLLERTLIKKNPVLTAAILKPYVEAILAKSFEILENAELIQVSLTKKP